MEQDFSFQRKLSRYISLLHRRRKQYMSDALKPYGLKGNLYLYLTCLHHNPGASQDFLCEYFKLDKGSVAKGAKLLAELDYIRREVDENDRRQYRLFLTEKGEKFIPTIYSFLQKWCDRITDGLSDEERFMLIRLLERMEENGKRRADQKS